MNETVQYDVVLKLFGEEVEFNGKPYALVRKMSAFSEDPEFPDMLCVEMRPIRLVPLEFLGEGRYCKGECGLPSRFKAWETTEPFLMDFMTTENPDENALW